MRTARLHLHPEGGAFPGVDRTLADAPGIRREALINMEWLADGSHALLYRIGGGSTARLRDLFAAHEEVRSADVVRTGADHVAFVHVREREALAELLAVAEAHALVLDPPFPFTEDGVRVTVVGDESALQAAYDDVADVVPVTVEWVGSYESGGGSVLARLTDRQRTALETAHELGFYETPRAVSYDDIAAELECAPTTANELLRRAEARIVEALLE